MHHLKPRLTFISLNTKSRTNTFATIESTLLKYKHTKIEKNNKNKKINKIKNNKKMKEAGLTYLYKRYIRYTKNLFSYLIYLTKRSYSPFLNTSHVMLYIMLALLLYLKIFVNFQFSSLF